MRGPRPQGEQGAVAVEFGLMFPLIALLIVGIYSFGVALTAKLNLDQAAREGVRVYAFEGGDPTAVTLGATSLPSAEVSVAFGGCPDPAAAPPNTQAWVRASYDFQVPGPISLLTGVGIPDEIPLSSKAVFRCGG